MKTITRIHAKDKRQNLLKALERLCWSDCHNGVSYNWIRNHISTMFHVTNTISSDLISVGFIEKKGKLYFHTGLTPSYKIVDELIAHRKNRMAYSKIKNINKPKSSRLELFEQMTTETFPMSQEEKEFLIAIRNLIKLNL